MNTPQNIYDYAPSHAIQLLETIDLIGLRKNNGIDMVIVVSKNWSRTNVRNAGC